MFNAREPDAALDELRFAFSLEPSPGYALSHLQGLCRVKRWDLALKAGEEYISRFRDDKPLLKQMAIIYENSGNDKAAAGIYEKLMSANPEEASLYVAAADFYRRKERYAEAVDLLKIGISRLPDEKNLYFALDGLYQLRRQNKEAAESLKSLLAYMPDDAEIYYIIALNYREARMQEEALAYMKKAVFHRPASEDYRYTLGIWYMELGLYAQSVEQIKKCLEINSKNKSCERAFDKIYKEVGITK
ncbi:MAG: tetratricopeptide repeat protein [Nitrospirae bacterium]|nr:tetratricopeptide repeat protein [Nitrospirota bacterium]